CHLQSISNRFPTLSISRNIHNMRNTEVNSRYDLHHHRLANLVLSLRSQRRRRPQQQRHNPHHIVGTHRIKPSPHP
ncbi:hypothetical protein JQN64_28700, partial [Escherichia coli]|nr:hypothetical protein [Escherichia coli]